MSTCSMRLEPASRLKRESRGWAEQARDDQPHNMTQADDESCRSSPGRCRNRCRSSGICQSWATCSPRLPSPMNDSRHCRWKRWRAACREPINTCSVAAGSRASTLSVGCIEDSGVVECSGTRGCCARFRMKPPCAGQANSTAGRPPAADQVAARDWRTSAGR